MISYRCKLRLALLLCLGALRCASAGAAQPAEDSFKESLGLDGYQSVTYQAEDGTVIPAAEFLSMQASGRSFSIIKKHEDDGTRHATLRIQSPAEKAARPKALPLAVQMGQPMPRAALADLRGVVRKLDGSGGRPLLLSFFFAECPPCIQEVPELNAFAQAHKTIDVVAVTFDAAAEANAFVAKHGLAWPVVANAAEYIEKLGVTSYPTMMLVAPDGKLIATRSGGVVGTASAAASPLDEWVRRSLQAR